MKEYKCGKYNYIFLIFIMTSNKHNKILNMKININI